MTERTITPYGSWKSPITSDLIVSESIVLSEPMVDGPDVYWIEGRPAEAGRYVLVRRSADGTIRDMIPPGMNARSRVHEYGGGACAVDGGVAYFLNFADQRLYRASGDGGARCVTEEADRRYADGLIDRARNRMICIREDYTAGGDQPANEVAAVDLDSGAETVLASGSDFYSSPRLSRDGAKLAYLAWDHPNMPWDGCCLWLADVRADGTLADGRVVAGGADESIFQPEFSPDGVLYFISERTGWWNLYRLGAGGVEAMCPMSAEFGLANWRFGMSTYAFESAGRLLCTWSQGGAQRLGRLDTDTKELAEIPLPYTQISWPRVAGGRMVFVGGSTTEPPAVVQIDLETMATQVLRRSTQLDIDEGYVSVPQAVEFPTTGGLTAHALYYAPTNVDHAGPPDERPPLIVHSHGGPTGSARSTLNLGIQYWTSRGFALVDVNYGGSTGYGREYRQRLGGQWGIVDVDDCVNAAKHLVRQGLADENRLAIAGGSAGGYTTLCALTFRDTFRAGASYFGVSDCEALARETHKFESRYLDGLIGPYPDQAELYRQRSPVHFTERLSCPVIFFQGLEDEVVPPNQAEKMVRALRDKHLPVAYVAFEGEQHGFRRAQNIKRSLDAELYFYSRVFGFELADPVEPVPIENL